jgi:hypothetical protein
VTLDATRIAAALALLSERPEIDAHAVLPVIRASLEHVRKGRLPGLLWLTDLLDNAVQVGVRFGAEMLLMRKMLHALEGVIADIGADRTCIDSVLLGRFFAKMAGEWPYRWLAWADSREFVTRLSNADLAGVMMGLPLTASRFWLGHAKKH